MRVRLLSRLLAETSGAVAPLIGVSLSALVAAGGLAFDYSRMVSLDTELQSAADQAALAAASQLDGKSGACSRAANAATALVANDTRFANDGKAHGVSVPLETGCDAVGNVRFYQDIGKTIAATSDANAKFVRVQVASRQANYALTPVVAMMNSGSQTGAAFASVHSAVCNAPPVMMCNPNEPAGNTNPLLDFNVDAMAGVGLRLVGDGSYAPGNFGFLDTNFGNGANNLLKALAYNNPPGTCIDTSVVTTKPGMNASVIDGLNTRFDIDANGNSCPSGGNCSPAANVRKDLVRGSSCGITGDGWQETDGQRYRPTTAAPISAANTPEQMGLPRDMCHAVSLDGTCVGGRVGDGSWDRAAYFRANYGNSFNWQSAVASVLRPGQSASSVTRYQVYKWEMTSGNLSNPETNGGHGKACGTKGHEAFDKPVCMPPGITPDDNTPDRRRIPVAVLNCNALSLHGAASNVPVARYIDVFLVEPSYDRTLCDSGKGCNTKITDKKDVYVEVIGSADSTGTANGQAQLVHKNVPYLIE